jgi:hypothetical protein
MAHRRFHGPGILGSVLLAVWAAATTLAAGEPHNTTATPTEPDWIFECAACPHNFYDLGPRSVGFDSEDNAHVVYGGEALYHAWESTAGWQVEIVENRLGAGSQAALVIDAEDTLHIFYLDEEAQSLGHASGTVGAWTLETVAANIGDEPWPSPALAPAGELHVAFRDGVQNRIVHAWRDTAAWQFSTVEAGGGYRPSLALDGSGRPHVSYVMAAPGPLRYAHYDGSWQVETVRSETSARQSALALDASGQPHLVGVSWDVLSYSYLDAGGWHHEEIGGGDPYDYPTLSTGDAISLVLDSAGQPHVAYTSFHSSVAPYPWVYFYRLRYASREGTGWAIHLLEGKDVTKDTGLALDGTGRAHMIAQQGADLLHLLFTDSWQSAVIDAGGTAGVAVSMAVDGRGSAHVVSRNTIDNTVRYAQRTDHSWQGEVIGWDPFHLHPGGTALAVAPDGFPHVLFDVWQYERFGGYYLSLAYRYRDASGWHVGRLGEGRGIPSSSYDIVVGPDGQVHAVWVNAEGSSLYYSPLPAGDPLTPELISDAEVRHAALGTDGAGGLHVAYSAGGSLHYAFRDGAGWHTEVASSSLLGVDQLALALDGAGRPHAGFYAAYSRDLYYARRDDSGWVAGLIDAAGDVGQYPAIAVTRDGAPHISYYDATNQDLKYARSDSSGWSWTTETLASEGDVGQYTSIDLYVYPHISYYDASHGDLRYVYQPFEPVAFSHLPLVFR